MNSLDLQLFNQAVALAQAGRTSQAHEMLRSLEITNGNDLNLLLWLAFTAPQLTQSQNYLDRATRLDPANAALPSARSWLIAQTEKAKQASAATFRTPQAVSTSTLLPEPELRPQPARSVSDFTTDLSQLRSQPLSTSSPALVAAPSTASMGDATGDKPAWYRPERDDDERDTTSKGGADRRSLLIRIGIGLVAAVVILGVVTVLLKVVLNSTADTSDPDRIAVQGLPVYPSSTRIVLSPKDRADVEAGVQSGLGQANANNFKTQVEVYLLKKVDRASAESYYQTELKKLGYTAPSTNQLQRAGFDYKFYLKGQGTLFITAISPLNNGNTLNSNNLSQYKVGPDDLILIVFTLQSLQHP